MKHWTLRARLMFMVLVPLLGMLWVSGWNTTDKLLLARDMQRMQGLVDLSTRIGALVHELQKERGMSAGFIGSAGANFARELPGQRAATDQRRADMAAAASALDTAAFGPALAGAVRDAGTLLDGLPSRREGVTKLAMPAPEVIGYYSKTIATLLGAAGQLSTLSSDKDIARLAAAYGALLQAKERAGQERALLSNAFGADRFSPDMLVRFVSVSSAQDTWFGSFRDYATEAQRTLADKTLAGKAVDDVAAYKRDALARMNAPSIGLDAKTWFAAATARIDLMKQVEDRLAGDLVGAMGELQRQATRVAAFYAITTVLSALLVFWLARKTVHQVLAQIGGEPTTAVSVAHAVADGKLDSTIQLAPGDEDSVLASMQRMQDQLNERITRERAMAEENLRIRIALDNVSTGVMIADPERNVIYANHAVRRLLKEAESDIRQQVPSFDAERMVGRNIDDFHRNPSHQATLLANLTKAHTADLNVGGRHLSVTANPVITADGTRAGTVAEWRDRTGEILAQQEVGALVTAAASGDFGRRIDLAGKEGFFRDIATGLNRLSETTERGLSDVARVMQALAQGDLTHTIDADYQGVFGRLKGDVNATIDRLRAVVGQIKEATDAINIAAREIAAGNTDLSSRTEEQASSLEQTSSSMEEMNETVKRNAENAGAANELARASNQSAIRGGQMVKDVVATMSGIQESSKKIADIVGVIDSIAFQTNILALNAAVEAARAGEQGRGFAVVATEVRNLAQRSATAAREIKTLINDSVTQIEAGAQRVDAAGTTMDEVVASFRQVAELVTDISNASHEQATGVDEVARAIGQMDEVTQQNAALVEQAAAAAESLEDQSRGLVAAVAMFKLQGGSTNLPGPALRDATPRALPG